MIKYLTTEEILYLHFKVIQDYGGLHGVRNEHSIASIVNAPRQEVFGSKLYKTVYEQTAYYIRALIKEHPFIDGNKRTAVSVAYVFLHRNNILLTAQPKDLENFAVNVAVNKLTIAQIANWIKLNTTKY